MVAKTCLEAICSVCDKHEVVFSLRLQPYCIQLIKYKIIAPLLPVSGLGLPTSAVAESGWGHVVGLVVRIALRGRRTHKTLGHDWSIHN